jgi:hypothetical protein
MRHLEPAPALLFTSFRRFYRVPDADWAPGVTTTSRAGAIERSLLAAPQDRRAGEWQGWGCAASPFSSASLAFPLDSTEPVSGVSFSSRVAAVTTNAVTAANAVTA